MDTIEIRNLTKRYKGFALEGLDLRLPMGCIMGLVGENGAGKSTTIKLILGLIHADEGEIILRGPDGGSLKKEEIGVVLDDVGISQCLTPAQVGKIMKHTFKKWDMDAYHGYLKEFSLPENKKFKDFSRGMKMKLGIAVALSHDAKLLILDEATAGLDPVIRDEILEIFSEFTRDETHSILISSHIISDLEKICDYVAFLHQGRLLVCEEKDALKERYGMVRLTADQDLEGAVMIGKKETPYGAEAIVRRDQIPAGMEVSPVDLEQLFIGMAKGARK